MYKYKIRSQKINGKNKRNLTLYANKNNIWVDFSFWADIIVSCIRKCYFFVKQTFHKCLVN